MDMACRCMLPICSLIHQSLWSFRVGKMDRPNAVWHRNNMSESTNGWMSESPAFPNVHHHFWYMSKFFVMLQGGEDEHTQGILTLKKTCQNPQMVGCQNSWQSPVHIHFSYETCKNSLDETIRIPNLLSKCLSESPVISNLPRHHDDWCIIVSKEGGNRCQPWVTCGCRIPTGLVPAVACHNPIPLYTCTWTLLNLYCIT